MGTRTRTLAILLAGHAALFGTWAAHAQSSPVTETSLNETLYRTVCERVQAPLVFSTRDTLFALSLPADEPAEIYLQLTVGKNGKVKNKLTKVHANHIANYVAPAFAAATEELRIDRELLAGMQGKDTSLILTFPMQYQCVYDTIIEVPHTASPLSSRSLGYVYTKHWEQSAAWIDAWNKSKIYPTPWYVLADNPYSFNKHMPKTDSYSGSVCFYLAFIHEPK